MIDPIAYGDVLEYVLPFDKEDPTVWLIGPLDSLIKTKLRTQMMDYDMSDPQNPKIVQKTKPLEHQLLIIKLGLKGFKNFKLKGKDLSFKTEKQKIMGIEREVVSDETIKHIPIMAHRYLADEIWAENEVSTEEEKNL